MDYMFFAQNLTCNSISVMMPCLISGKTEIMHPVASFGSAGERKVERRRFLRNDCENIKGIYRNNACRGGLFKEYCTVFVGRTFRESRKIDSSRATTRKRTMHARFTVYPHACQKS